MKEYHRSIFFTKVPLTGYYRYKDEFQIFPAELENMPKSKYQKHYPNILEYYTIPNEAVAIPEEFKGLEELYLLATTTIDVQEKILSLLSAISNNLFFRYTSIDGNWAIPLHDDEEKAKQEFASSKWCLTLYHSTELPKQLKINKFSEVAYSEIEKLDHKSFYTYDPNIDFDSKKSVVLPDTINEIIDAFYKLDDTKRTFLESAISNCVSSIELKNSKKTLSLLASFTVMETMVNLEYINQKPEKCDDCGQLKFSVAKKFREYLLKYIGESANNKKKFNAYYSLRSKIVHTGQQLKTENLFADVPEDVKDEEFLKRIEILQMGKLSIVNWLLFNLRLGQI